MDTFETGKKKCNYCGEDIAVDAKRCPYCGSTFESGIEQQVPPDTEANYVTEEIDADENFREVPPVIENAVNGTVPQQPNVSGSMNNTVNNQSPKGLGNGMKVFITTICTFVPFLGQIAGLIVAIVFMNSGSKDKKSFGVALLVATLVTFVVWCLWCFVLVLAFRVISPQSYPYY